MGRQKQKQYQYNGIEEKFSFIRSYESMSEVYEKYYYGSKIPMYQNGKKYHVLPDGTYLSNFRIGRGLLLEIRKWEDPTVYKRSDDKRIVIYNSIGEQVGFVDNIRILNAIQNDTINNINSKLLSKRKTNRLSNFGSLKFKYIKR